MTRIKLVALALALSASAGPMMYGIDCHSDNSLKTDPYKSCGRSKGEKARNKKLRG